MTVVDVYMLGSEHRTRRSVAIIQVDKENINNLNTKVVVPLAFNIINADLRENVSLAKKLIWFFKKKSLHYSIKLLSWLRFVSKKKNHKPSKNLLLRIIDYIIKQ